MPYFLSKDGKRLSPTEQKAVLSGHTLGFGNANHTIASPSARSWFKETPEIRRAIRRRLGRDFENATYVIDEPLPWRTEEEKFAALSEPQRIVWLWGRDEKRTLYGESVTFEEARADPDLGWKPPHFIVYTLAEFIEEFDRLPRSIREIEALKRTYSAVWMRA